jgi:hypothetical protein
MKLYSFLNNLIDDIDPVWKPISEENEWQNNNSEYQYGKRGNLPQTSCLMSTNEYFDTALNSPNIIIDNVRQGFWQYSKHNSVALLNNINIETYVQQNYIEDLTPEQDVNWYHCSTPASKCIKFGVLYDPVNWFLKNLKFDNNLRTNVTGHYRGTYMIGKHYLLDLLNNNTEWWMESQTSQFKRYNCDLILREDIIFANMEAHMEAAFHKHQWECGFRSVMSMLLKKQGAVYNDTRRHAHWGRMPHHSKFNICLERHLPLEESAWNFMKDPEVWSTFLERYDDDFKFGNFLNTPRTTSWADYQRHRTLQGDCETWLKE